MAGNPRQDLFLQISRNLVDNELRGLRNYVSGANILAAGFVETADAQEIFIQLERERKLKPGDLTLLAHVLTEIGRCDYAEMAEKVAEDERKAALQALLYFTPSPSSRAEDQDIFGSCPSKRPRVSDEQQMENKLKDERAKQLELLRQAGEHQLALLKKAEGLLSREKIEQKTEEMLDNIYQSSLQIVNVKMGCAILHLVPQSLDALERFWRDYKSGQLSSNLNNCLITDEMRSLVGKDLAVGVIMLEEQYRQWTEYFKAGDMGEAVQKLQSLTMTPEVSQRGPSTSTTTWETFVEEYLEGNTEQIKLLLDSAWRDPVVELVVLIPFFWPHIITYWLERNHTFPQTLTELLQYSLSKHFARKSGSVSEQGCAPMSETVTESLIQLGSKGLGSIVQSNNREIDLKPEETKGFDPAVFDLLQLNENKRYTFVNTFLHDFCVALYIKDTLDKSTNPTILQQLVQNAGRMPLVCFFTSGLLSDRAGDFLSGLAKGGVFNSPFEKVETCLIALAETCHVQSLYQCIESVFDEGVLDVSSETVLSLLFSSAAIRFVNQSHAVQSVRLCDRSKLKKEELEILSELEAEPEMDTVYLSNDLWSDVSDRRFILLLMQCIPLLSAVKNAGSKSKEPNMFKTPLKITVYMYSPGTINSTQMLQLVQTMKHMFSLTDLDLTWCNYVEDDLPLDSQISPSTKYCSKSKLTTSPTTMFMSSLPRLACLQDLELDKCSFLSATEVDVMCNSIKGPWQLMKLNITVLQAEWNDAMGAAIGELLPRLSNLMKLRISNGLEKSQTALSHAVKHLSTLKKLQRLHISVQMSDDEAKALADSLQHSECLEVFQLINCKISDTGCSAIAEVFVNKRLLKTLMLSSNQMSLSGAKSFAAHVGNLVCLEHLHLSHNKLSDDGCIVITEAFHKMKSVKRLHLDGNNISVSGAKSFAANVGYLSCLEDLFLRNNKLSDDGCIVITEAFHKMKSVKRLHLDGNNISASGAKSFAAHVGKLLCLEDLDLSRNKLSDDGCIVIVETFHKMKSVRHLNLSSNEISDRGGAVLMGKISLLTNLHRIDLTGNMMTDAIAQLVADTVSVKQMVWLWHVDLSFNCFSSEGVQILKQHHNIRSDDQHPEWYLHRHTPLETSTSELFYKGTKGHTSLSMPSAPSSLFKPSLSSQTLSRDEGRYEMSEVEGKIHQKGTGSMQEESEVDETSQVK
ncbi:uncharacterized protein LOC144924756 [Branchiostoma floridae x Branchiostoma belcheri]